MKTLVIDTNCNIKEVDFVYENFSELYKKCGYRSCNNYVCIESVDTKSGTLEFWGKKSKSGYEYFTRILYGKCCIVLKNANEIQELTIEEYNKNILKYLEGNDNDNGNGNDNGNDNDNDNGNGNDNDKVNNPDDEEQYEDCEGDCEEDCEDDNLDGERGDKVDDDIPDDDGDNQEDDNQEDDNGDIHDKECLDVDEADEEDISENENYADDEEDNLDDTNTDKKKTSKNSKNGKNSNIIKNSKNSKNIVNNTNEHLFNVKVDMDNTIVNRNKIDIDELVSNELVAEEYIYTSDEDY